MKKIKLRFILIVLAFTKLTNSSSPVYKVKSRRTDSFITPDNGFWRNENSKIFREKQDSENTDGQDSSDNNQGVSEEPPPSLIEVDSSKSSTIIHIPQINFYSSIPNGVGVITNGLLWLRELSAAIGTPLPIFIGAVPAVVFGFLMFFVPDLSSLGLPLFYPDGAPGDPLAAFPPVPELSIEDFTDFEAMKTAFKQFFLIPQDWF